MEVDISTLVQSLIGGAGVWLAIKAEIRLMWRDIDRIHKRIDKVEQK